MTDVSDRRREPKGIPTGGEFAKEDSGAADAADLEEAAFERAEREADEYYSSLTDEDLERQWMEESGRTPSPSTPEGRRDPDPDPERGADKESERQRAEQTGSHPAPNPRARRRRGPNQASTRNATGSGMPWSDSIRVHKPAPGWPAIRACWPWSEPMGMRAPSP